MCLISACVCGIEFCYAAETAFVSPTLLQVTFLYIRNQHNSSQPEWKTENVNELDWLFHAHGSAKVSYILGSKSNLLF